MTNTTTLPAGRELDALVAEKVLGWRYWYCPHREAVGLWPPRKRDRQSFALDSRLATAEERKDLLFHDFDRYVPACSTDIAAAMLIVERFHARRDCVSIAWLNGHPPDFQQMRWEVHFRRSRVCAVADTLPEAICRAALKAVEGGMGDARLRELVKRITGRAGERSS